jgi:hypothetical protein
VRSRPAGRLRRSVVIVGVLGLTAAAGLLTADSALAGEGAQPGDLDLLQAGVVVTSGPLATTTTWETTTACPAGYQTSARLSEWTTGATPTEISLISPATSTGLASPGFTGSLDAPPGTILAVAGISASSPGTVEWVVGCYAGASGTGAVQYEMSLFVSEASGATDFTTGDGGGPGTPTTMTLTASPNPATTGNTVILTASVEGADGSFPAGTAQFEVGGTDIGSPVAVNTGNVDVPAATTTSFSSAGTEDLSAVFTPVNTTNYFGSIGTYTLGVDQPGPPATGSPVPITVTIAPSGTLTVTVVNTAVPLTINSAGTAATGTLGNVTVTDTRNSYPGWSVSGQQSAFTEAAPGTATIPGDQMGWVPGAVGTLGSGVTLGPTVAPGTSPGGLGDTGGVLFSATPGNGEGTNVANAALTLDIPAGTPAGSYSGSITVTYLSVGP